MKTILIYLGHPAQYHFFKNITKKLRNKDYTVKYLIRSKDILENLLISDNEDYINILPKCRRNNILGLAYSLVKRDVLVLLQTLKIKPTLMIGTDASIAHVGKMLSIPVITVLEDDAHVVPLLAKSTFPFSTHLVVPSICDCGRWNYKKIPYSGYMKLSYLHPNYFFAKDSSFNRVLIRLSALNAHHDFGVKGLDENFLKELIKYLENFNEVKLISENKLESEFDKYNLKIKPTEIHKHLFQSKLLISDSQSMTMEAAMLGIPSIRISDFVGQIGVLEELEKEYKLTYGVKPHNKQQVFDILKYLDSFQDLRGEFQSRRKKMLHDKIDVAEFFYWLVENYPKSITMMKDDPNLQYQFK